MNLGKGLDRLHFYNQFTFNEQVNSIAAFELH